MPYITDKLVITTLHCFGNEYEEDLTLLWRLTAHELEALETPAQLAYDLQEKFPGTTTAIHIPVSGIVPASERFYLERDDDMFSFEDFEINTMVLSDADQYLNLQRLEQQAVRVKGLQQLCFWKDVLYFELHADHGSLYESYEIPYDSLGLEVLK